MDREARLKNRLKLKRRNVSRFVYESPEKSDKDLYVTSESSSDEATVVRKMPKRKVLPRKRGRKSLGTEPESSESEYEEEEEEKEKEIRPIKKRDSSKKAKTPRKSTRIEKNIKNSRKFSPADFESNPVLKPMSKSRSKKLCVKETDPAIDPSTISLSQACLAELPDKPKKKRAPKKPEKVRKQVAIQTSPIRFEDDELDAYLPPEYYDEAAIRFDEVMLEVEQNHLFENEENAIINNDDFDDLINYINSPAQNDDEELFNLINFF